MASAAYNPTFKRPTHSRPPYLTSPSPPHAFIEPLSPPRPAPIEPNFNYPALNTNPLFNAQPGPGFAAPPRARARAQSASHKSAHQRTPSSIDALAEVALASSPSYNGHRKSSSTNFRVNGYNHGNDLQHQYGVSEPPHKRTRSELLPSPQIAYQASRPATSYEPSAWSHSGQQGGGYNSRVEEAALLLNFQSGGWPNSPPNGNPLAPAAPAAAPRPHANSFPQAAAPLRPPYQALHAQQPVRPPSHPVDIHKQHPILSSPEVERAQPTHHGAVPPYAIVDRDVEMKDAVAFEVSWDHTNDVSRIAEDLKSTGQSSEVTASEGSHETQKRNRGWPKGKPRGPNGRKTVAEKAATKRSTAKRKMPASRNNKSKSAAATEDMKMAPENRRKSLSDAFVSGEHDNGAATARLSQRAVSVPVDTPMMIREAFVPKSARKKADVHPDTICAGCGTSRETANSHGVFDEWIKCDGCKKWFHIDCAGFKTAHDVRDVDKYFCAACEPNHGKTTYVRKSTRAHASVDYAELQRGVLKTSEESAEHHYIQPIKDGTFTFDPETFPRMRPEMVTREFFEKSNTFTEPICIPASWNPRPWTKGERSMRSSEMSAVNSAQDDNLANALAEDFEYETVPDWGQDRLEMVMPEGLTVRHVCNLIGGDWPIDVIDVKTQNSGAKWPLSRWADYYEEVADTKAIRNVISLEVSQTKLGRMLQRPKVVRDLDLQDDVWPQEEIDKGKFPKVQFYCLMSVADSYTDFHIDFGGSSVYYHILKGKKTFFFIPPKAKHLKAYQDWNDSPQQNFTFLPSITNECYRVDLHEGDTMLIPSGWIHAVWTPADSLVIGGNFLNRLSYNNQFKVVEIEKANETPMKFRYPSFQKVMWYTVIKYLKTDPLPAEVRQLFYEGKRFERQVPVWADFDGGMASQDSRAGAHNARYYGQAELEGLPELVNFIFRTVMIVMGKVEGVSADRMKRVNASIPKGNGEPLELAKTFALWVAWKRGSEDPPAWAHPDAVLPSSKEEGAPKKLSEKKLKELERKEAIAAYYAAGPDRQSLRVMSKNASAAATAAPNATTATNGESSTPPPQPQNHHMATSFHQSQPFAPSQSTPGHAPPPFMMNGTPSQYLSTPKTSVLGPKRVACDACRKRRIKCKHKDLVQQITPQQSLDPALRVGLEMHDNITVTPAKQGELTNYSYANGEHYVDGQGPLPGTSAYLSANIPMTMNGVPMFGDAAKRGRSKACYECRKSKRRCIHDEQGNVDATKAAEQPVPRGSNSQKKKQMSEERQRSPILKKQKIEPDGSPSYTPIQTPQRSQMVGHGVLKPNYNPPTGDERRMEARASNERNDSRAPESTARHNVANIDPSLYNQYNGSENQGSYNENNHSYPYPAAEHSQPYPQANSAYQMPSLEQIANEVLDMSGHDGPPSSLPDGFDQIRAFNAIGLGSVANGLPNAPREADGSVDSAVSLPPQGPADKLKTNGDQNTLNTKVKVNGEDTHRPDEESMPNGQPHSPPLNEASNDPANQQPEPAPAASPTTSKSTVNDLPLYQPPAPLAKSPERTRAQPVMVNGVAHGKCPSPAVATTPGKRKRDSMSATPSSARGTKKVKVEGTIPEGSAVADEDERSVELAKMLQQEERGLRRRSSRE